MRTTGSLLLGLLGFIFLALTACTEEEAPPNPFDGILYPDPDDTLSVSDSTSIAGLHQNIFSKKCANPGCHDGTFEPDFRTVESSFSTLVYMPVNKLTVDSQQYFSLRVIPGDYQNSFLYERLVTPTSDYMPSNGVRLNATEIAQVKAWIDAGCPDVTGNLPQKPNLPPNVIGYIATNSLFQRIDTIRVSGISYNPFIAPANSLIYIPFLALDTADGSSATPPAQFTLAQIAFSTMKDDFSSAQFINASYLGIPADIWQVQVNTSSWSSGTTVYFRIRLNDGFQSSPVEFPKNTSPDFYKTFYSFIVN